MNIGGTNININKFFAKFPVIDLGDIVLREMMLKDTIIYYDMMSDEDFAFYKSDEGLPKSLTDAENDIRFFSMLFYKRYGLAWTIADKDTDEMIGAMNYGSWNLYNAKTEIAYEIVKKYWGRGIMTRVLKKMIDFGFDDMGLARIEARTMQGNSVSQRLLVKTGFKKEGIERNYRYIRGKFEDINLYSMTPQDRA